MNPFSDLQPGEEILRQERLHRGVFALPALVVVALLLPTIPLFIFIFPTVFIMMLAPMIKSLITGGLGF